MHTTIKSKINPKLLNPEVVTHQGKEKENTPMLKGAAHQEKERRENNG